MKMKICLWSFIIFVHLDEYFGLSDRSSSDMCNDYGIGYGITTYIQGQCLLFTNTTRSWNDSEEFCKKLCVGSTMVVKIDKEKQDKIESILHTHFQDEDAWIGLRRTVDGNKWVSDVITTEQWFPYISENNNENSGQGQCVATAGADTDRIGGGWRYLPCEKEIGTMCQIDIGVFTCTSPTATPRVRNSTTSSSSSSSTTTTTTTTTATMTTTTTSTTTTRMSTSKTSSEKSSMKNALKTTTRQPTIIISTVIDFVMKKTSSTEEADREERQKKELSKESIIAIVAVVTGIFLLLLTGVGFVYWRRRKATPTATANNTNYTPINQQLVVVHLENTHGQSGCDYAVPGSAYMGSQSNNIQYDHLMAGNVQGPVGNVAEQTYDIANLHQGKQLRSTVDATYDTAMFSKSDIEADNNVYDHAQVTLMTSSESNKKNILSHYDHTFVQ